MTEPPRTPRTRRRKPVRFLVFAALLLLGAALFWVWDNEEDAVESAGLPSSDQPVPSTGSSSGYQIENGVVAWRPMTTAEQFAAIALTLGMATNTDTVRGNTLPLADAASFRTIAAEYGLDRAHVWFRGDLLDGADPASFEVLDFAFSRDRTHIWKGATLVLQFSPDRSNNVQVHSDLIFSVDAETYLAAEPTVLLPESPATPPSHYCRDWFLMNDAIWLGETEVLPVDSEVKLVDCDGGIRMVYEDGVPLEDIDSNYGLTVITNGAVQRLTRAGDTTRLATMPERITETRLTANSFRNDSVLLARAASGAVYAVAAQPGIPAQLLGHFNALPDSNAIVLGRAFWLGDRYFTLNEPSEAMEYVVKDHGRAERFGSMALADGVLFSGSQVVARPGDMSLRMINDNTVLIGVACYNYGDYVTDVADPAAEVPEITEVCQTMRRPDDVLYDGLRIGFQPTLTLLGPSDTNPGFVSYSLGEVFFENETDQTRELPADFLQSIELRVDGTLILPPDGAWDEQGVRLEPGQRHSWTLQEDTNDDPQYWGWSLSMRHNAVRAQVFDDAQFYIGNGQFLR